MNRIAILNTSLEVNGWEASADHNGSTYDISIVHSDDPTKKYIYKQKLNGAEAAKALEDLKTVLKDSKAMQFVKSLKFFKVNASKKVGLKSEGLIREVVAKAPPGWKKTVEHMKEHKEIENPFALAWYMKEKGDKPHPNKKRKKKTFSENIDKIADLVVTLDQS